MLFCVCFVIFINRKKQKKNKINECDVVVDSIHSKWVYKINKKGPLSFFIKNTRNDTIVCLL